MKTVEQLHATSDTALTTTIWQEKRKFGSTTIKQQFGSGADVHRSLSSLTQ